MKHHRLSYPDCILQNSTFLMLEESGFCFNAFHIGRAFTDVGRLSLAESGHAGADVFWFSIAQKWWVQ